MGRAEGQPSPGEEGFARATFVAALLIQLVKPEGRQRIR